MYQKTERFLRVAFILYPVDSIISNKVRKIPMFLNSVIILRNEIRIVVVTLSGDYLPVIKAGGQAFIQARLGPLKELATKLWVKRTPSAAMRSRFGVSM